MSESSIIHESTIDDYVHRYHALRKKSFDSVIDLAKLVADAEITLEHRFETFLGLIELDRTSSTYRKYATIAKAAPRLELYRDILPPCWTTLYKIAKLEPALFEQIKSCFHPNLTANELAAAIAELKPPQQPAAQPVCQTHDEAIVRVEDKECDEPDDDAEPHEPDDADELDEHKETVESDETVKPHKPVERLTSNAFSQPDEEPKIVISLKKLSQEQRQLLREQLATLRAMFAFEMIESTTAERELADVD